MNFDLEMDNCFLMERYNKKILVVDKDCIKDRSKVKVGSLIKIVQYIRSYIVTSIYYDFINDIYILGLEVEILWNLKKYGLFLLKSLFWNY